jgi:glycosyltransferase involved in cell wall biosynthesis
MILHLHSRYRVTGGEERVVEELMELTRAELREPVRLLARDSGRLRWRTAAAGLLRGGLGPDEVARAVERGGARVVHAHNLHPTLGWRALAAARRAGARVVLHVHQYRLVCAVGVCFTRGAECTRCHGRNTLPGVLLRCRGGTAEALAYGAALALWQRRVLAQADALIVPSRFALARLGELGAELPSERVHVLPPPLHASASRSGAGSGEYALVASRLSAEKGVDVAIEACALAGVPLVVVGEGPQRELLQARASGAGAAVPAVRFLGRVAPERLAQLYAGAALALVPSLAPESFGLAAAEAMAAGLPVVGTRVGALPELLDAEALVAAGDVTAMATAVGRLWRDARAGEGNLARVRELCDPPRIAAALAGVYAHATA